MLHLYLLTVHPFICLYFKLQESRGEIPDPECRGRVEGSLSGVRYESRSPRRVSHVLEAAVHEFLRDRKGP